MSESIYRALKNLAARESQSENTFTKQIKSPPAYWYIISVSMILLSLLIFVIYKKYNLVTLIFLSIGYVGLILHPFVLAIYYRKSLYKFIRNPLGVVIDNTKRTHKLDERYLNYFLSRKKESLQKVLVELSAQKESFEKRTSLIVGAIDKIGLFPGIFAIIISISKIKDIETDFVVAIAYIIPIMYLFGVYTHFFISRIDRHIRLINYAIEHKP